MKSLAVINENFRKLGILPLICINIWVSISMSACQNSESTEIKQEQLNNNSSGMDQDHTAAPLDTLESSGIENMDTTQLGNPASTVDSVQQKF